MERSHRARMSAFLGSFLLVMSQAGNAVTVAETPLFIATSVTPNVMLVVDNSGSMASIIWAPAYDPKVTYPDWSPTRLVGGTCAGGTVFQEGWTSLDASVTYSTLITTRYRGTCDGVAVTPVGMQCTNAAQTRGVSADGLTRKCLTLPSPAGGITRYTGNYLNYLFATYATGTDLTTGLIPNDYRMNVAKNVSDDVVNNNTNLRLGLFTFNGNDGGRLLQNCNTGNTAALTADVAALAATGNTPLGETLYEVTRYFRGMEGFYEDDVSYTSPIQYRCQKNFVIVITDGYPTQDMAFDLDDPEDPDNRLPNWDGVATATTAAEYPNFLSGSDGFQPSGSQANEGYSLYLDDIAKFAYDIDLRTGLNDDTGTSFDDDRFPQQNLVTYTVGFAVANQMMQDAADNGTGVYYQANDEADLTAALQAALADIDARTSSASAVATNTTRVAADTFIFQAKFSTSDWGGQLLAFPIGDDGSVGTLNGDGIPVLGARTGWNAADELPAAGDRNIFTWNPGANSGTEFEWANLTSGQQAELNKDVAGATDGLGEKRLEYLRGDDELEAPDGPFRTRSSKLGDIINSDPIYVGRQNYGFDLLPDSEGTSYKAYRASSAYRNRPAMVYVASNDGMLHGFDVETGVERFAYMPNAVIPELTYLTDESYNTNHRLINDGSPASFDAYLGGGWKTVVLGSLGGGGKGVYALDVTDPDDFAAGDVLWEFTSDDDSNMGVALPQPSIGRLANGDWAAIVANGYNSSGTAVLFLLDLETGAVIREFDTGVGSDNGLSAPAPVDVDGDRIIDYIYAGDLKGNMWKFDVTSEDEGDWAIAFSGAPLYTACSADPCTSTNRQPITAAPDVGLNPPSGYFVYFGTGRYFAVGDNGTGTGANTLYAIRDKNSKGSGTSDLPTAGRSTLVQQTVLVNGRQVDFGDYSEGIRVTSNNGITDDDDGWYLDLPDSGERVVSGPLLRSGRIIFTSIIPSGDECSAGGTSWLMELNALTGSRLAEAPLDLNRDRSFDVYDFVQLDPNDPNSPMVAISGLKSKVGITKGPAFVIDGDVEYLFIGGTDEGGGGPGGNPPTCPANMWCPTGGVPIQRGRQSWREVE